MNEKEITFCGHDVKMIYCAATENLFESITSKSIAIFVPTLKKNEKGETVIDKPAEATIGDYSILGVAAIMAYYLKNKQESPVGVDDMLYGAKPLERNILINTVAELRNQWYDVPAVVADAVKNENEEIKEEKDSKNAQAPTIDT